MALLNVDRQCDCITRKFCWPDEEHLKFSNVVNMYNLKVELISNCSCTSSSCKDI